MKRLLNLLWMALLLVSCNEVDEFKVTTSLQMSILSVKPSSELTWDEMEQLATYNGGSVNYTAEELRRMPFLLVEGTVVPYDRSSYCYLNWRGDNESESTLASADLLGEANGRLYYLVNRQLINQETSSLSLWMEMYTYVDDMTGFIDNCLTGGGDVVLYTSEPQEYTFDGSIPYFEDCMVEATSDYLQSGIHAYGNLCNTEQIQSAGLCYSSTNTLPTVDDQVKRMDYWEDWMYSLDVTAYPTEAGVYYVRAFAETASGVSYSSVWKVTVGGVELPFEYSVGQLVDVSALSYDDVANLIQGMPQDVFDYMRREGGWMLKVEIPADQEADVMVSDNPAKLPSIEQPDWTGYAPFKILDETGGNERFYFLPVIFLSDYSLKGNTLYYKLGIPMGNSWSDYVYSGVYSYERSSLPLLGVFDCVRLGSSNDGTVGYSLSCMVYSWPDETEQLKTGICYSTSNQLPRVDDADTAILTNEQTVVSGTALSVVHSFAPGTYYVRAFAQSAVGVGYSPVQKLVVE